MLDPSKLASATVAGQIKISEPIGASHSLTGSAASAALTLTKVALLSAGSEICTVQSMDTGIQRIQARMLVTARSILFDSQDLASWVKRVQEA